jgi:ABC-type sugar transport system ATPase subunit
MGQSELFLSLFGMTSLSAGHIEIDGRRVRIASPHDALGERVGMCLLPEDRNAVTGAIRTPKRSPICR